MLKNRKIFVWGKTNFDTKLEVREYNPSFKDDFYKNQGDFYIHDINCVWNDMIDLTLFKVFDVS